MSEQPTKIRLSKTVLGVTFAHFVLLLLIGFWPARKTEIPPQMTMIEMIDSVSTIPSSKGPAPEPKIATGPTLGNPAEPPPAAAKNPPLSLPPPPSSPPVAEPKQSPLPPPVEKSPEKQSEPPTEEAPPVESEKKDDFAIKDPKNQKKNLKKESQEISKPVAKSSEPKKSAVKINLKEVVRTGEEGVKSQTKLSPSPSNSSLRPSSSKNNSLGESASPSEITSRLGSALSKSGTGGAVQIGPISSPGGGSGNFGTYYDLIRKQMFSAWNRPVHLTQKDLSALVKITIEKDGRISNVALVSGSGIRDFDESILEAARRVGKIREPLPEGLNHEITIRFKLDD